MNGFKELIEENELQTTDNINEALWLLKDGTMIDGEYDFGMRGQDHRIIECLLDDLDRYDGEVFWNEVHKRFGAIRLVPETGYALIKQGQQLSAIQEEILSETDYQIEEY